MRTPSKLGSPTTVLDKRAISFSVTASKCLAGTIARLMAVHFCPALVVISRATSLTNRSNSSSSGLTSMPKIEQFKESASALNGMLFFTKLG